MKTNSPERNNKSDSGIGLKETLLIYTIIGIATHSELQKDFVPLYHRHQFDAIVAYRENKLYRHPAFSSYVATDEKMIIMVASLYAMYERQGTGREFILKYLRQGYKRIFDYLERTPKIDFHHLINFIKNRTTEHISDNKLCTYIGIVLYIGDESKIQIDSLAIKLINDLVKTVSFQIDANAIEFMASLKEKYEPQALKAFQSITGVKILRSENLDALFERIEGKLTAQIQDGKSLNDPSEIFYEVNKKTFFRYLQPLSAILRSKGLFDFNFYSKTEFSRDEYVEIYALFQDAINKGRLTNDDFEAYLVSALLILMLVKQYKDLKDTYINYNEDGIYKVIQQKEELFQQYKQIKEEEHTYKTEICELQEKVNKQEEYINKIERQLKEISRLHEEDDLLRKEVVALREYVFREQQVQDYNEEVLNKPSLDHLKIAIVGGHQKWHARLKNEYPFIRTIHPEERTIDYSFLSNMDIVCFETTYSNHVIYRRAMSELGNSNVIIHYCNGQKNVEDLSRELIVLKNSNK